MAPLPHNIYSNTSQGLSLRILDVSVSLCFFLGKENVVSDTAQRIVEIQRLLIAGVMSNTTRVILVQEQRELWDREYAGRPFDDIARDAWLTKRALYL